MNFITDLCAEVVSYLTVMQDICKRSLEKQDREQSESLLLKDLFRSPYSKEACQDFEIRIGEIIWSSIGEDAKAKKVTAFFLIAENFADWLELYHSSQQTSRIDVFSSPYMLRQQISEALYDYPENRIRLSAIIGYVPLQVIQALGGKGLNLYRQRLYQVYDLRYANQELDAAKHIAMGTVSIAPVIAPAPNQLSPALSLISAKDDERNKRWWNTIFNGKPRFEQAALLLREDKRQLKDLPETKADLRDRRYHLLNDLVKQEVPVPFESIFDREMDEVIQSRNQRCPRPEDPWTFPPAQHIAADPMQRAQDMQLAGLALSGGGIRSATFNLGLIQKLAELGALPRFDYLSTVSGGGYIGSWLVSWLARTRSFSKVTDRLNPKKSPDPWADEVRPIRWLRMFSNYLTPNSSIMSTDSWAMGVTWLRNTVINQIILLLLLLTALSGIASIYHAWSYFSTLAAEPSYSKVLLWSAVIFLPGSVMAGIGMRSFDRHQPPQGWLNRGTSGWLAHGLIAWVTLAAFFVTTWFCTGLAAYCGYQAKVDLLLLPCSLMGFCGMLIVASIGRYYTVGGRLFWLVTAILISSAVASLASVYILAGVWQLLETLNSTPAVWGIGALSGKMILITGVPLILESVCICVVIRMVIMGVLFPDDRREWWGRLGGMLHRFMLLWVLTSTAALILPDAFHSRELSKLTEKMPVLLGGWAAIVGWAVKLAFQPKNSGDKPARSGMNLADLFVRFAPYLFMIGFLLIGSYLLEYLYSLFDQFTHKGQHNPWACALITAGMAVLTLVLSWRVGVNEFSLHYFYRNRLVRAYLGATRRRTDRENTANSFTGFDKKDDFPMADLTYAKQYYGPYPLINTALNATVVSALDRQDRKAESFIFSPLFCGFDFSPTRSAAYTRNQVYEYGYRPTHSYSQTGGPTLGSAMAISGAAVNPNMGYHSSSATAFLLTVFNVRLGWWIGNPRLDDWNRSNPKSGLAYLIKDLIGKSDIDSDYVSLSDGGHFDNMGLYELVRRRCTYVLLGDAEQDQQSSCEGLANAIRRCRIDFGVEIELDLTPILKKDKESSLVKDHLVSGTITYPGTDSSTDPPLVGTIVYIKTALSEKLIPVDVREYQLNNPEFPQQSTGDQFFDEAQFESYRKLGYQSLQSIGQLHLPA